MTTSSPFAPRASRWTALGRSAGALLAAAARRARDRMYATGGRGGKDGPPDLDELWRDFNRKLSGLFGNTGGPVRTPLPGGDGGGGPGFPRDMIEFEGGVRRPRVFVSARDGEGLDVLRQVLVEAAAGTLFAAAPRLNGGPPASDEGDDGDARPVVDNPPAAHHPSDT